MSGEKTLTERLASWAAPLTLDDVPERVVALARSQVLSQLTAARAGLSHPLGSAIVSAFGEPTQDDPKQAAYTLSALSMALDFDETFYAGHVAHSTVNVPLAFAAALDLDGRDVLTAVITATECATRIGAATTLGPFRGQSAAHPHVVGAAASRLRAGNAPEDLWVNALGVAMAMPPWMLRTAFLGSDAKVLTAATGVRMGLDAHDAAAAGLTGAREILEHPLGFLAAFGGDVPLPDEMVVGLGRRWHTETITFKVHPASTGISTAIDCAVALHDQLSADELGTLEEVVIEANMLTLRIDEATAEFVDGPRSCVSALQYSLAYGVATALLNGRLSTADFTTPATEDPARWALVERTRLEHDLDLTIGAILATAPIGEALRRAGGRAPEWFLAYGGGDAASAAKKVGPPSDESFSEANKAVGARVRVRLRDGREIEETRVHARGATGPDTRSIHHEIVREKFLSVGGCEDIADAVANLDSLGAGEVSELVASALAGAQASAGAGGMASSRPM